VAVAVALDPDLMREPAQMVAGMEPRWVTARPALQDVVAVAVVEA
jgi:hypothetical protein